MTKEKRALLEKTFQTFVEVGLSGENVGILDDMVAKDIVGFGTTIDEKIFGVKEMSDLLLRQKKQSAGMDMKWKINTLDIHISSDENTAIFTNEVMLYITVEGNAIEMYLRFSVVLEYPQDKWLVVHWHGSKPEQVESEKDTWGIDSWKQRAEELEGLVAEKTADLVKKNRDLEVEAALERVRAMTMAMHNSGDVGKCIIKMFSELTALGVDEGTRFGIGILNYDNENNQLWTARKDGEEVNMHIGHLDMTWHPLLKSARKAWKEQVPLHKYVLEGEDLLDYYRMLNSAPDYKIQIPIEKLPQKEIQHCFIFEHGFFYAFTPREFQSELILITQRFSSLFEQTYRRYLDLVKAESQAREAKIEAALERVRAASMAMHKSDELLQVIQTLSVQLLHLGIQAEAVSFLTDGDENGYNMWLSSPGEDFLSKIFIPRIQDRTALLFLEAKEHGKRSYSYVLSKEEKDIYFDNFFNNTVLRDYPDNGKEQVFAAPGMATTNVLLNTIILSVSNFGNIPYSDAENEIINRIANVFQQSYIRFLDLQKAEAQAREAQIEAALERIRAKALAMHNSGELTEVAKVLREQMELLGQRELETSAVHLYDEDAGNILSWRAFRLSSDLEGKINYGFFRIPKHSCEIAREFVQKFESSAADYTIEISGSRQAEWYNILFKLAPEVHAAMEQSGTTREIRYYHFSKFSGGALLMVSSKEPSIDSIELQKRAAQVFDLAYRRFKDLQKAEAQAREAQIEAALERVRAKTMAMHSSNDVSMATATLFTELDKLGVQNLRGGIAIITPDQKQEVWSVNHLPEGITLRAIGTFDMRLHPYWQQLYDAFENQAEFIYYRLAGNDKENYIALLNKTPHYLEQPIKVFPDVHIQSYLFGEGAIWTNSLQPHSEDEKQIMKKFVSVFSLTFRRYLDLQKAEAQVREAQIEAALERVRAKTMAMHKSEQLPETAQVLFEQFAELGKIPDRIAIGIIKEDLQVIEWWVTDQTGSQLARHFDASIGEPAIAPYFTGWKEGKDSIMVDLSGKALEEWVAYVRDIVRMPIDDRNMRGRRVHHGAFFSQGLLLISAHEPMPDETIQLLVRFAKVFNQTYTRFLDLQKAEAQAREAEIELGLERVRARAMAMQKSDELSALVDTLFKELSRLDFALNWCIINIIDEPSLTNMVWAANPETNKPPESYLMKFEDYPFHHSMLKGYRERKAKHVYVIEGEEKKIYDEYLFNETEWRRVPKAAQDASRAMKRYVATFSFSNFGGLQTVGEEYLSEQNLDILSRFGRVFDLTYTRFNDLQKAEAQAREARIEAALEKVRSRTMGMQKSDELQDAALLLFQQVQELGIPPFACGFNIWDEDKQAATAWMGSVKGLQPPFKTDSSKDVYLPIRNAAQNGEQLIAIEQSGADLEEHYGYLATIPTFRDIILPDFRKKGLSIPTYQIIHCAFFSQGYLMFITYEPVEEAFDIFKRFAKVFEQTYTRFLDLQKAEAQAREAQIEAALERVRSRSMAMHKSDELLEAGEIIFVEMQRLGIESLTAGFVLMDKAETNGLNYAPHPGTKKIMSVPVIIPHNETIQLQKVVENWKKGDAFFILEMDETETIQHQTFIAERSTNFPLTAAELISISPASLILHNFYFKEGYILIVGGNKLSVEQTDIMLRFAKVFQQTYTRFLDLQKAEAQAREAEVQLALERVRARSMAMHKSDELADLSLELVKQVQNLGIKTWFCAFNIYGDDPRGSVEWGSNGEGTFPQYLTPREGIFMRYYENGQNGETFLLNEIGEEECPAHYEYLCSLPGVGDQLLKLKDAGLPFPKSQIDHVAFFKYGYIIFITFEPVPEAHGVFKRFAQVFEQTYTRFLDLQRAEAQTREAKIEASLEKVRSRTMGMQSSEELPIVANLLFLEVQALGIPAWSCGYCILRDDRKSSNCIMSSEGALQMPFVLPHSGEVSFDEWDDFIQGNETFFTQELGGTAIESHYGFMKSLPQLAPVFRELEDAGLSLPVYQVNHLAKFTQGFLLFITYEKVPAAHDIFKRFTKVFEQTYTRFLDLKKAEEQARKAQIENSLEKVRSRSLAMQAPEELIEVAKLLREEMGALGVEELETSSIYIHDENSGTTQCWFTIKDAAAPDKAVTDQIIINLQDTMVGQMMLDFYRSKAKQTSILMQGEQRIEWIRYCEEKSDLFGSAGFYGENIPDRTYHLCKFSDGFIGAAAPGDISEESRELLQRVTAVFSFAYTRFRDLQTAEESARSSRRQASLDRIRADISSMRSTEDLDRIIPLIWNELTTLGIPFIRCGVFMVDDKKETVSVHLSSPDGTPLAAMNLAFAANELTSGVVKAWRKGEVYRQHWDKDDFLNYGKSMVAQGQVKDLKSYQGEADAPESLHLHFIPFSQGLLYVGALQILEEDQIDLVTMLARAFAIAYARYEDFVKLEEAKTAVESTLGELKATQGQLVQQEKLASLGQLTAGIAHEIKNPLNFVNNFSEVSLELIDESLEEMNRAQETRDETLLSENLAHIRLNIQKVLDHGSRANSIVNSMLMHSRGGTGRAEPTMLNDFIREYSNLAYHGMRAGNHPLDVQMIFDLDESVKEVRLIAEDFSRVVLNICNNAFDAMRTTKKPALTICTLLQKDYVRIYFEDNGPGIPDEIKDKILQPFFTTKKGTEGTGLGLSISHDIVKAHGGALSVETKDGNGSIFIIQLPVL